MGQFLDISVAEREAVVQLICVLNDRHLGNGGGKAGRRSWSAYPDPVKATQPFKRSTVPSGRRLPEERICNPSAKFIRSVMVPHIHTCQRACTKSCKSHITVTRSEDPPRLDNRGRLAKSTARTGWMLLPQAVRWGLNAFWTHLELLKTSFPAPGAGKSQGVSC